LKQANTKKPVVRNNKGPQTTGSHRMKEEDPQHNTNLTLGQILLPCSLLLYSLTDSESDVIEKANCIHKLSFDSSGAL
ncbi:hypothetical protein P7K49_029540, partial [Saguinus oedipus]